MHLTGITPYRILAQRATQHPERLIERMARLRLLFLRPQQPDEVIAGSAAGGACQVYQEREVLPPEKLRRGWTTVGGNLDWTEQPAADH
jgi:hypothetical protein